MPIIQVHMLEGRTPEVKKQLIVEITAAAVRALDTKPEAVRVLLYELEPAHWAVGGKSKADSVTAVQDQSGKC